MNQLLNDKDSVELQKVSASFKNLSEALNMAKRVNVSLGPLLSNSNLMKQLEEQGRAFSRINETTLKPMQEAMNKYHEYSKEISRGLENVTRAVNDGAGSSGDAYRSPTDHPGPLRLPPTWRLS